jgi:hypothetical protein
MANMPKVPVPVENIMNDPDLSISSSPFSPGNMIIKNASFKAGETPDHLEEFAIPDGHDGNGMTGTVMYEGKPTPKAAVAVAAQQAEDAQTRRKAQRALGQD